MADPEAQIAEHLESLGLVLRYSKAGRVLSVDARSMTGNSATTIDDTLLRQLVSLDRLKHLILPGTSITNAGLKLLVKLQKLEVLELDRTAISDDGIASVLELPQLKLLNLTGTEVSRESVAVLRKKLINCRIIQQ